MPCRQSRSDTGLGPGDRSGHGGSNGSHAAGLHRRLKGWSSWAAGQLDVADVPAAEVVRILVEILTSNSEDVEMARPVVRAVMEELRARQQ
ncbi:hypothetical protein ACGFS9_01805 [Streptomyces sp. NPDC048566]|uniref:hypothetical protein n=1 Tax=Streptomyces sp. NPDC048566 TaxID=3365569 RepID=UPI003715BE4D